MSFGSGKGKAKATIDVIRGNPPATDRERFLAVLNTGPITPPDAVVVLVGEDALPRLHHGTGRFMQFSHWAKQNPKHEYVPTFVMTGGRHQPPRWFGADPLRPKAVAGGISNSIIMTDNYSQDTHEQAVAVVDMAEANDWTALELVASAYHMPRAFLTFLRELERRGLDHDIRLMPAPVDHTPWWDAPVGMECKRIDLLDLEFAKIEQYTEHVASYLAGLDYIRYWETHEPERRVAA